ncbi:MAG: ABC transporter, permease protein 1 (cluster 5, nickel/peptides/opines) [uncultured Truepera sp.]|uniref:ABC transporter, permease protein 1 (Cluster 5, nickel/peptides/opines) n=1 Tax=uncultured Truepera sp. TaxID=543023 RepID=A0A6J4VL61_9DEIN|nr:MAG: ABC transporter, permease protein 1 (cluster 5, nickel/peptides/opines) [uncultured Truepera sp.]
MWSYILKRIVQSVGVILGVTLITFLALHMGGDPTYLYVSERASAEEIAATRATLGFDRPLHVQYLSFLGGLVRGDLGNSLSYRTPALQVVLERFPATLELTLFAMLIAILFSIPLGVVSSLKRGTPVDGSIMMVAMFGQSIPSFWLGIMLILFVGLGLGWLPISGHVPILAPLFQGDLATAWANFPRAVPYLVMPAVSISLFSLSRNARLVRSSMLEVLSQDYVRTARAKGIPPYGVVVRHALRNAWMPVVTMLGLEFGFLLSGVVVVETIFSWPGVGRLVFNAINQRDIPLVQAAVILFSLLFVGLNLLVDLLYARLDPRVRLG